MRFDSFDMCVYMYVPLIPKSYRDGSAKNLSLEKLMKVRAEH